jgi:hypothetical protein
MSRISIYDSPRVLLEQVVDGEWDQRTLSNTLFNSDGLSPSEREGVTARLKSMVGNNSLSNAFIDVATNPWALLFFFTSAPGSRAIASGKSLFMRPGRTFVESLREQAGYMQQLGTLTAAQVLHWGDSVDAARAVANVIKNKAAEFNPIDEALSGWMASKGIRTHPDKLVGAQKEAYDRARMIVESSLRGADRDQVRQVVTEIGENGMPQIKEWTEHAWLRGKDSGYLENLLRTEGLTEVRDQMRKFYEKRGADLFAVDGATTLTRDNIDSNKVLRAWRGLKNEVVNSGGEATANIRRVLGDDITDLVNSGKLTEEGFKKVVKDVFAADITTFYSPRNVWRLEHEGARAATRGVSDIYATPSAIARSRRHPLYAPEDLDTFARVHGDAVSDAFRNLQKEQAEKYAELMSKGERFRVAKIEPFEAARRYENETARTYAFHTVDAAKDDVLRVGQKEHYAGYKSDIKFENTDTPLTSVFAEVPESARPRGGFSYADVFAATHATLKEDYARDMLKHVLIPAISGRQGVKHLSTTAGWLWSRHALGELGNSWIGRNLAEYGGEWGKKVTNEWREGAKLPASMMAEESGKLTRTTAAFLYGTHLGFNAGSALVNMLQPLTMAAGQIGALDVLQGYRDGFAALGAYASKRIEKYKFRPISQAERSALIRESVPNAELLGLDVGQLSQVDRLAFERGARIGRETPAEKYLNFSMGLFSNMEIVNRVTTASAVSSAYRRTGRAAEIGSGGWKRNVQNLVSETQFGSGPLNTPLAFMTDDPRFTRFGAVGANSLARMFLSYPLRTLTGSLYSARFVGGADSWKPAVQSFVRGMGISAIMFEAGKNVLGINMERAGLFAGVTDLIPGFRGGRFDEREAPLPIPPIIDIPYSLAKAITTDDKVLLANTLHRVNPFGGIALGKALGALPSLPVVGFLQKNSVDWGSPLPDGSVPVFDANRNLISYQRPASIILRAFGLDAGTQQDEADRNRYIRSQIEEIRTYRRRATDALVEGRQRDYQAVEAEFERRFKMPLVITQQQIAASRESRVTPRIERAFQSLPSTMKPLYRQYLGQQGAPPSTKFDERTREVEAAATPQPPPFAGFSPY